MSKAILALEDGSIFSGLAPGRTGTTAGEIVFTTAMIGYQEILTDPSYAGEIITFTFPTIGNYGVSNRNDIDQSRTSFASGMICSTLSNSAVRDGKSWALAELLKEDNIYCLTNIDTRKLTKILRTRGAMNGCLTTELSVSEAVEYAKSAPDLNHQDLVGQVTCPQTYEIPALGKHKFNVAVIDCGLKRGILTELAKVGCHLVIYPSSVTAKEVLSNNFDGLFISNGPGDPKSLINTLVPQIRQISECLPTFGICLGHQLLALAYGLDTYKLKFGHRGGNHPVLNLLTQKAAITSQNHGYAVFAPQPNREDNDLVDFPISYYPANEDVFITHLNLTDHSVEGLKHRKLNLFSVQYHPEAYPGPHDSRELFHQFVQIMENARGSYG